MFHNPRGEHGSQASEPTVDRIHRRWEYTGARTWIRIRDGEHSELWCPFAPRFQGGGARSVWKNLSGTRLRLREVHPSGRLVFEHEWSTAAELGLVRSARLWAPRGPSGEARRPLLEERGDALPRFIAVQALHERIALGVQLLALATAARRPILIRI